MRRTLCLFSDHLPLVRLPPNATIYRFGTPTSASRDEALLRFGPGGWVIRRDPGKVEGWAIVGDGDGRRYIVETLLSRHRIHPVSPPPGPFPYLTSLTSLASSSSAVTGPAQVERPVRHLAFARPPSTGEFTDFTARYGSLQEEDKLSFRQTLAALHPRQTDNDIEDVAKTMRIGHLLDLPGVSLSSGQTRRARIAAALLTRPALLLLEDPMAGLDVASRVEVSHSLGRLNEGGMRVVLVLRGKGKGSMPNWVDRVCEVRNGDVWIGSREEWEKSRSEEATAEKRVKAPPISMDQVEEPVVMLKDVSVSYGEGTRRVLDTVSWTIRPGEKWHLQGANGSGKTTLLSLILGHHPRSFSLPPSSLMLFSKPRRSTPTPTLRTLIGHTSPEIYASFPRGMGLSASGSIGSGFQGVFSRRPLTADQTRRVLDLLEPFVDVLQSARPSRRHGQATRKDTAEEMAQRLFAHFTPSQQALLLFLRAIVAGPPLVILDEPSQGMDEVMWARCGQLLEKEWEIFPGQAVVVVSHYEDEVPWGRGRGRVLRLEEGRATVEKT